MPNFHKRKIVRAGKVVFQHEKDGTQFVEVVSALPLKFETDVILDNVRVPTTFKIGDYTIIQDTNTGSLVFKKGDVTKCILK